VVKNISLTNLQKFACLYAEFRHALLSGSNEEGKSHRVMATLRLVLTVVSQVIGIAYILSQRDRIGKKPVQPHPHYNASTQFGMWVVLYPWRYDSSFNMYPAYKSVWF
jgi:hypothetical protein